jgi:hypothetical protein
VRSPVQAEVCLASCEEEHVLGGMRVCVCVCVCVRGKYLG